MARKINGRHMIKIKLIDDKENSKDYLMWFVAETDP